MANEILLNAVILAVALAILLKGADYFTESAANIARQLGVSDLVIGLTLVAFATSLPELTVGVTAALSGSQGIALGNVIGSNIANIGLILAAVALLVKVKIDRDSRKSAALMLIATIIGSALIIGGISAVDGALLFSMIVIYVAHTLLVARPKAKAIVPEVKANWPKLVMLLILSSGGIIVGSKFVVESAANIARILGVTEIVIGITIIAIGTSLPELTSSLYAARKGYAGMAVGNIVGSNLFNLSAILGIAAIIAPISITSRVAVIDIPFMILFAVLLVALMHEKKRIRRIEGVMFLGIYAVFIFLQLVKI